MLLKTGFAQIIVGFKLSEETDGIEKGIPFEYDKNHDGRGKKRFGIFNFTICVSKHFLILFFLKWRPVAETTSAPMNRHF